MHKSKENDIKVASLDETSLYLSPFYQSACNAITQSAHFVVCSRYLVQKWGAELGGDGLLLVLFLRSRCYYNPSTGEKRNNVQIPTAEVAQACSMSVRTLQRYLQTNKAIGYFVKIQTEFAVEEKRGGLHQAPNTYTVSMDDPIHPSDYVKLKEEIKRRENAERKLPESPQERARRRHDISLETIKTQNEADNKATPRQIDAVLCDQTPRQIDAVSYEEQHPVKLTQHSNIQRKSEILINKQHTVEYASDAVETNVVVFNEIHVKDLVARMVEIGVTEKIAHAIAKAFPENQIIFQLESLPFRNPRDPAATLIRSLRENWAPPASYAEERNKRSKPQRIRQIIRQRDDKSSDNAVHRDEDGYWNAMNETERAIIREEALRRMKDEIPFIGSRYDPDNPGPIAKATLESYRIDIIRERMTTLK